MIEVLKNLGVGLVMIAAAVVAVLLVIGVCELVSMSPFVGGCAFATSMILVAAYIVGWSIRRTTCSNN